MKDGFIFKKDGNRKAVILFHGMTGSPFELVLYGKALHKAGYDIYCPILPGHCSGVETVKKTSFQEWHEFALNYFDETSLAYDQTFLSGLCLGAVIAVTIAQERENVAGVSALSTTLFLDGWMMPWFKFLFPIGLYTILKFFYVFPEKEPYGIKNEQVRKKVEKAMKSNTKILDCIPMISVVELLKYSKYSINNMKKLKAPIILFHSEEDDLTSIKSANCVYNNSASAIKEFVKLKNSYHIITLDNEKDVVINKTVEFFDNISGIATNSLSETVEAQV